MPQIKILFFRHLIMLKKTGRSLLLQQVSDYDTMTQLTFFHYFQRKNDQLALINSTITLYSAWS